MKSGVLSMQVTWLNWDLLLKQASKNDTVRKAREVCVAVHLQGDVSAHLATFEADEKGGHGAHDSEARPSPLEAAAEWFSV